MNTKKLSYWKVWSFKTRIFEKYKKADYTIMLLEGTLRKHIIDTDKQAKEKFEILMKQMLDKNPIDENLKDTDPLKWVGLMNNYKYSAEKLCILN